ncbi:MAG: hypothetical protein KAT90_04395 [Gammaproteobacteria bacterium]|nr:hypothetical protein [Gammaproteobacteria bacterium]
MYDRHLDFDEVRTFISESSETTAIYIGCDSQVHSKNKAKVTSFARTIVVHKDGNKGCRVFGDVVVKKVFGPIRDRLLAEVEIVLELFEEIYLSCGDRPFQIHLDVNSDKRFESNKVMAEAVGWVRGVTGIDPKVKPDAFAASFAADKGAKRKV